MSEVYLNRPTPLGIELGKQLARFADAAEAEQKKSFPNLKERCKTCAFRLGTIPNGCSETLMDALKCVMEFHDFMCHETMHNGEPQGVCQGWLLMCSQSKGRIEVPWDYSKPAERPK
jgi:hypothetical protein